MRKFIAKLFKLRLPDDSVDASQINWWVNREIPAWLDKMESFEDFEKRTKLACASWWWKSIALGMAKEHWGRKEDVDRSKIF